MLSGKFSKNVSDAPIFSKTKANLARGQYIKIANIWLIMYLNLCGNALTTILIILLILHITLGYRKLSDVYTQAHPHPYTCELDLPSVEECLID